MHEVAIITVLHADYWEGMEAHGWMTLGTKYCGLEILGPNNVSSYVKYDEVINSIVVLCLQWYVVITAVHHVCILLSY